MHHIREGKHGASSPQQAIAIGLSKARRAGVKLAPPKRDRSSARVRKPAQRDLAKGRSRGRRTSRTRSRAAARRRGSAAKHSAAMTTVRTKGKSGLRHAARKAARTRTRRPR
jgi:hypothetical protein